MSDWWLASSFWLTMDVVLSKYNEWDWKTEEIFFSSANRRHACFSWLKGQSDPCEVAWYAIRSPERFYWQTQRIESQEFEFDRAKTAQEFFLMFTVSSWEPAKAGLSSICKINLKTIRTGNRKSGICKALNWKNKFEIALQIAVFQVNIKCCRSNSVIPRGIRTMVG
jgi:hypothetical protein